MNIEEIKADLEAIERIRAERDEAFYKIRPEDFTGCLPYDKFLKAQQEVDSKKDEKISAIEEKYSDIFSRCGVCLCPPHDSSDIDDFLKFFLALYDQLVV